VAALLERLSPLVALLAQANDPTAAAGDAVAAAQAGDVADLVAAVSAHVVDGDLVGSVLRHAGALTPQGQLAADAVVTVGQAAVLLEAAQEAWAPALSSTITPAWELVLTVPGFLRDAYTTLNSRGGRPVAQETGQALLSVATRAERSLIVAAPFLHTGFTQVLAGSVRRVLTNGGEVLVITRALSFSSPERSSANVAAVAVLQDAALQAGRGSITVRSWEEDRLGIHFKTVVADSLVAYLGSANLTPAGAVGHAEAGTLLRGAAVRRLEEWLRAAGDALLGRSLPHG